MVIKKCPYQRKSSIAGSSEIDTYMLSSSNSPMGAVFLGVSEMKAIQAYMNELESSETQIEYNPLWADESYIATLDKRSKEYKNYKQYLIQNNI